MKQHTNASEPFRHSHKCPIGRGEARLSAIRRGIQTPNKLHVGVIVACGEDAATVEALAESGTGKAVLVVFGDGAEIIAVRTGDTLAMMPNEMIPLDGGVGTVIFLEREPANGHASILATAEMVA